MNASTNVVSEQVNRDATQLLELCVEAYSVFSALGNLTEDLRVLSFNAEFASGRAGAKGNCVRVLTQATRELVNNLSRRYENIEHLKGKANTFADGARQALGGAAPVPATADPQEGGPPPEVLVAQANRQDAPRLIEQLRELVRLNDQLSGEVGSIGAIAQECDGIAVAIAVEAATAGVFREEFQQVADTMHRYVEELQNMVTQVGRNVRRARDRGTRLIDRLGDATKAA